MKILLIHNDYKIAGGETTVFHAEKRLLEEKGHEVFAYTRHNGEIDKYSLTQNLGLFLNTAWSSRSFDEIDQLIPREQPDIAHFHNTLPLISPAAYYACQLNNVPVVQTLHNFRLMCPVATFFRNGQICEDCSEKSLLESVKHGCYRDSRLQTLAVARMLAKHRRLKTYIEKVDAYIALTEFHRRKFMRTGIPAEKIFIKPNFVHPPKNSHEKNAGNYALFLGRLSKEKGVETLLHAWRKVRDIPLCIAGDGPEKNALQQLTRQLELKNVTFAGFLDRETCASTLRAARFLVLPSIWYEGLPMVLLEAFAMGKPVIASKIGGLGSIVKDGETGRLFEAGNPDDLARVLRDLEQNPDKITEMGDAAKSEFLTNYTPETNYKTLLHIYEQVLAAQSNKYLHEAKT